MDALSDGFAAQHYMGPVPSESSVVNAIVSQFSAGSVSRGLKNFRCCQHRLQRKRTTCPKTEKPTSDSGVEKPLIFHEKPCPTEIHTSIHAEVDIDPPSTETYTSNLGVGSSPFLSPTKMSVTSMSPLSVVVNPFSAELSQTSRDLARALGALLQLEEKLSHIDEEVQETSNLFREEMSRHEAEKREAEATYSNSCLNQAQAISPDDVHHSKYARLIQLNNYGYVWGIGSVHEVEFEQDLAMHPYAAKHLDDGTIIRRYDLKGSSSEDRQHRQACSREDLAECRSAEAAYQSATVRRDILQALAEEKFQKATHSFDQQRLQLKEEKEQLMKEKEHLQLEEERLTEEEKKCQFIKDLLQTFVKEQYEENKRCQLEEETSFDDTKGCQLERKQLQFEKKKQQFEERKWLYEFEDAKRQYQFEQAKFEDEKRQHQIEQAKFTDEKGRHEVGAAKRQKKEKYIAKKKNPRRPRGLEAVKLEEKETRPPNPLPQVSHELISTQVGPASFGSLSSDVVRRPRGLPSVAEAIDTSQSASQSAPGRSSDLAGHGLVPALTIPFDTFMHSSSLSTLVDGSSTGVGSDCKLRSALKKSYSDVLKTPAGAVNGLGNTQRYNTPVPADDVVVPLSTPAKSGDQGDAHVRTGPNLTESSQQKWVRKGPDNRLERVTE
jgi:hypothetical protein